MNLTWRGHSIEMFTQKIMRLHFIEMNLDYIRNRPTIQVDIYEFLKNLFPTSLTLYPFF
jgi:hypothetical protein